MKKCYICKTTEELYSSSAYQSVCRSCNTEKKRKYRLTDTGKAAVLRAVKKYEASHPERKRAWGLAGYSVPSEPCKVCGVSPAHRHHPDIAKPLLVVSLCPLHHKQAERGQLVLQ